MTQTVSRGAANQAGARIDTDAYAKAADFLPLKGIDHVEFWVGNARQAAAYYRALWGFTPVAFSGLETKVRDRASYVMVQNDIRFVFTAPLTPDGEIAEHVRAHGDGVHDIAFAVDDVESAWRETTTRGAVSALAPTELDGGEDGVLRRVLDPHLRRGPPLVRRSARLHRRLRARLSQGQVVRPGRRRAVAARGRPLRRQRRAGPDGRVRRLLSRRPRLRPADPLRRQGHPHRVLGADVQGHDQRQRPDQVPDQRAGRGQEEEPDPGIPRLVSLARLPAHRAADRGHRRPPSAGCATTASSSWDSRTSTTRRWPTASATSASRSTRSRSSASRPTATRRATSSRSSPARSRTARRSSSRSSSGTARAASGSATSRRCSRRSSASRPSAGTSRRALSTAPGRGVGRRPVGQERARAYTRRAPSRPLSSCDPAVLELEPGPVEQVPGRRGHEDLTGTGQRRDPRGGVDGDPARVATRHGRPRPCADQPGSRCRGARTASVIAAAQRTARAALSNSARNPSPGRHDLAASEAVELGAQQVVVVEQDAPPRGVAEAGESRRRIDDVGEQDRRQRPLVLLVGGDPESSARSRTRRRRTSRRRRPTRRGRAGSRRRRRPRCRAPCRRPSRRGDAHRSRSRDGGSGTTACRRRA